jgi:hypothetical protein
MYDFRTALELPDCASTDGRVARALRTASESISKPITRLTFLETPCAKVVIARQLHTPHEEKALQKSACKPERFSWQAESLNQSRPNYS